MNRVQFVETRERVRSFVLQDRWEFKPKGRLQFLQRLAWRLLHWRGALEQAIAHETTYTRHVIDTEDVLKRLMKQRAALFDFGAEPKELLIGSEDFAEMMDAAEIRRSVSFYVEHGARDQIMGLKVRVIPWMRGMLVMPREGS